MGIRNRSILWLAAGVGVGMLARQAVRKRRLFSLYGKTVLITGGSRGLGFEIAKRLADAGARLALCSRDLEELKQAEAELKSRGAEVFILPADVTDKNAVDSIVHAVTERFGPIDVLINNAGVIGVGPLEDMEIHDFEAAMQVHYYAPLYMTLAALPGMRRQRRGRIVNIASIGGKISVPHMLPYCGSKFALVGLSGGLRAELLKDNIYVTTVCPGLMRTGGENHAHFSNDNPAESALFKSAANSPLTSMDAGTAARQIVEALKYGDPEVVLSLQAQAGVVAQSLFPGLVADLFGVVSRFLPQSAKSEHEPRQKIAPGILNALTEGATRHASE